MFASYIEILWWFLLKMCFSRFNLMSHNFFFFSSTSERERNRNLTDLYTLDPTLKFVYKWIYHNILDELLSDGENLFE